MLARFSLVAFLVGCGGNEAAVIVDAGNGCIVTRPPPDQQQCTWQATTSSGAACGTTLDASSPQTNTCDQIDGHGCFTTDTCMRVCGVSSCQPDPMADPNVVSCGNHCL